MTSFTELRRRVPGVSHRVLAQTLHDWAGTHMREVDAHRASRSPR